MSPSPRLRPSPGRAGRPQDPPALGERSWSGCPGDRLALGAWPDGRKTAAKNDSITIGIYRLWGLADLVLAWCWLGAGLVLARASRGCYVDPVLPFPYLGLLVAHLC